MADTITLDSGFDLDVLEDNGIYAVVSPLNAPQSGQNYLVEVVGGNVGGISCCIQTATNVLTTQKAVRTKRGGAWLPWNKPPEQLSGATTFYLNASTGSNTNSGRSESEPWATLTHAFTFIRDNCHGQTIYLRLADGTYNGPDPLFAYAYSGVISVEAFGGAASRDAVIIRPAAGNTLWNFFALGCQLNLSLFNFTIDLNGTAIAGMNFNSSGTYVEYGNIRFMGASHANTNAALIIGTSGAVLRAGSSVILDPGANWRRLIRATSHGYVELLGATANSPVAWASEAFLSDTGSIIRLLDGPTGTFTGKRYAANNGGTIIGSSQNMASWGNVDGTVSAGGTVNALDTLSHNGGPAGYNPTFTTTTLPAASAHTGYSIYVSNAAGGAILAFSDGTNWRRCDDRAIVS